MLIIEVLTLFPGYFESPLKTGILKKAIDSGLINVDIVDIRRFTANRHKTADDYPFGGGVGMVMKPEPVFRAIRHSVLCGIRPWVILTTPQGKRLSQDGAKRLARHRKLAVICGRYEGIDERVSEKLVDEEVSIGDYILSGGEAAALVLIEAVIRFVPGVVGKDESVSTDTFSDKFLKYPQYTRPASYLGMEVPDVLVSGDHKKIAEWRQRESIKRTVKRRPDIIDPDDLTEKEKGIIEGIKKG